MLVARKRGVIVPAAFLVGAAAIMAVHVLLGTDGTIIGSPEMMGTLAMMAAMVGLVGIAYRFIGGAPGMLRPGEPIERRARLLKYGVLVSVPITTIIFDTLAFTDIDPIGGLTATVPQLFLDPSGWSGNQFFWYKAAFTVAVIGAVAVVDRAWCRYLCPVGAMYAPTNMFSVSDIKFDGSVCIHCQRCIRACPMAINPKEDKRDPECIRCMRCIDACPVEAQRLTIFNVGKRGGPHGQG
jgi:NAD-dependent dihydropyrimidine dehydrogenase PreA subunit